MFRKISNCLPALGVGFSGLTTLSRPKSVLIFTIQRATSTILYRIFAQAVEGRDGEYPKGSCLLEPTSQAFHLENGLGEMVGFERQENWPRTTEESKSLMLSKVRKGFTVIKDQSYQWQHLIDDDYLAQILQYAQPIFLIRSPEATIASGLYPYYVANDVTEFSEEEVGFVAQEQLFQRCAKILGREPDVIEAESYLAEPEKVLPAYFARLNLPWHQSYLTMKTMSDLELRADPAVAVWGAAWYKDAFTTSQVTPKNLSRGSFAPKYKEMLKDPLVNRRYQEALARSLDSYQTLKQRVPALL